MPIHGTTRKIIAAITGSLLATAAIAQEAFIEEVIVTAQKREQNIQDVPVAVSAYSGAVLQEAGIRDLAELAAIAPSLRANTSQNATTASFAIRGIGTSSQNFGLESSVGLYVDGVYRARQSSVINNLVDIQAVEVLRGPQGTLFGKNTPSGAIQMRSVAPSHERNAFFDVSAGDFGLLNVSAAGNVSLVPDVLAARATVFYGSRDGYVDDLGFGSDKLNDRDRAGGRLQLLYTPTDRFDMRVIADYSELNEICCAALTRQGNVTAFGRTDAQGGPIFGSDALLLQLGGTVFSGDQFEDYTVALNNLPESSNNDSGLSVEMNFDFERFTLTSISAYRQFDSFDFIDGDFSNVDIFTDTNASEQDSFSQEFRITGDWGDRATYVAGVYYFTQDLSNVSTLRLGPAGSPFLSADPQLAQLIAGINAISAASNGALPPAADAFPTGGFATDDMQQEQDSIALFIQSDFELTDALVLTAGLRYTDEEKTLEGRFLNSPLGPAPDLRPTGAILTNLFLASNGQPFDPAAFAPLYVPGWGLYTQPALAPQGDLNEKLSDDQVTGTIKLSWFATDNTMFYASFGTGFKSGGTNTDRIDPAFDQVFGPETSDAFEIGMKGDFPDQNLRLNVALHNTQVSDLQTVAFAGNGFNLQNAGNADTYGAEIEAWWSPTATLAIQASYIYNVADFEDFPNGTCWVATPFHTGVDDPGRVDPNLPVCDRSGDRVPDNNEHGLFLAATQDFRVADTVMAYVRGEYWYRSDTMTDGNNDPLKERDSFDNVNLRVGFLFDELDAELTIWGRNLTDERFYETVFDVPLQNGKLNAYPHEPRTWGIGFRKFFD